MTDQMIQTTIKGLQIGFRQDWTFQIRRQSNGRVTLIGTDASGRRGEFFDAIGRREGSWAK
jgi:hypothetical protein